MLSGRGPGLGNLLQLWNFGYTHFNFNKLNLVKHND